MMRASRKFAQAKLLINRRFIYLTSIGLLGLLIIFLVSDYNLLSASLAVFLDADYRRRPACTCFRPRLPPSPSFSKLEQNENRSFLCSPYATRRGFHQRVIAISLFGPKQAKRFVLHQTLAYLDLLIKDLNTVYGDGFLLRIYHDDTINATDIICPIECAHPNVDFCDMNHKLYIPPKIWRFIPAGDPLVDIMMSRDLDSALTQRERAAVDKWLASGKSFHAMRDHPLHTVPMLGGLWGFRPSRDPNISRVIHARLHNKDLVRQYGGVLDQEFLSVHVWPLAKSNVIAHDSFLCRNGYGNKPEPFPTQRRSANETNCFIGCVRPCCGHGKLPFGPCPLQCRPKDHPEWIYC